MDKKNRRNYGDSSLILVAIATLSEKPIPFRGWVVHDHRGNGFYYCHPSGKTLDGREIKPDFCPLVEIPDWHDVNYLLPSFGEDVLIYDDDTGIHLGFLSQYGNWETDECTLDNVTHWQQITPPEK